MKYVMLICGDFAGWDALSEAETKALYDEMAAYTAKWEALGKWARPGVQLDAPSTARTLHSKGDGGFVVTDGPYTDIKEIIGGFLFIEADDIDEAVAIASEWPGLAHGETLEIRPMITGS